MILLPDPCRGCPIDHKAGFSIVSGSGETPLLVVAEASGRHEERLGRPLIETAPSGGVFEKALSVSGLTRDPLSLTNILRCRPPGNELRGMPYERGAIDHCRPYLDQTVEERKPNLILALGDLPLRELSKVEGTITELRGFVLPSRYGIPMIATYHPSFLARGAMHLFGVFMHDVRRAHQYATRGVPERIPTDYVTQPTHELVRDYLDRLAANDRVLPSAYDIETASILGEPEPEDWREKKIIQIQFSSAVGTALVLPWEDPWIEAACTILATDNMKWGWNDRLSDRLALKRYVKIGGEQHDLMNAFAHLQPNFMSGKDDPHGDKGVPSKLMSLQSCLSFYYPEEGPWKGSVQEAVAAVIEAFNNIVETPDKEMKAHLQLQWVKGSTRVQDTLRYYGGRDADYTFRVGVKIFASLKKLGLW